MSPRLRWGEHAARFGVYEGSGRKHRREKMATSKRGCHGAMQPLLRESGARCHHGKGVPLPPSTPRRGRLCRKPYCSTRCNRMLPGAARASP